MKKAILLLVITGLLFGVAAFKPKQPFQPIAVIELFTSQGCSSCPAADKLLAQTIMEAKKDGRKIFALSFHVDYWNRLGWADPISAKEYSQRQGAYATQLKLSSAYTPQMVVNGSREFVGSDKHDLKDALNKSLNAMPVEGFKLLAVSVKNNAQPKVKFLLDGTYAGCKINFALVSLSETTAIKRGENGGLTLTNENVVRQFVSIPAIAEGEISFKASQCLQAITWLLLLTFSKPIRLKLLVLPRRR